MLLWEYYTSGPLLANATALLNVCGARTEEDREDVLLVLNKFFLCKNGFWHHTRADEEIGKRTSISKQRQLVGRKGGLAKATRLLEQTVKQKPTQSQSQSQLQKEEPNRGDLYSSEPIDEAPPENLHPLNYARKLLEDLTLPVTPDNQRIIACAVEAEIKSGKSAAAAYEFILAGTKDARDEGFEINRFFFSDAKYRIENRNNGHVRKNRTEATIGTQSFDTLGNRAVIEEMKRLKKHEH